MIPTCRKISCGEPRSIENGRFVGISFLFQDQVRYICDDGFHLSNPNSSDIVCQDNKSWGPNSTPTCERNSCPTPTQLLNGIYNSTKTDFVFGDTISYYCEKGFRFVKIGEENNRRRLSERVGKRESTCMADRSWSPINSTCKRVVCAIVPTRVGGYAVFPFEKVHVYEENVTYYCNRGYEPSSGKQDEEAVTCQHDGQWSSDYISPCTKVKCRVPINVRNSVLSSSFGSTDEFKRYRERIYYKCEKGYKMIGDDQIRCEYNREWSKSPPKCDPVLCNSLPALPHATQTTAIRDKRHADEPLPPDADIPVKQAPTVKQLESYFFSDIVHFQCDSGYELEATEVDFVRCESDRNWSTPYPICVPITCEPLPGILNGQRLGNKFTYQQNLTYICNEGYHPNGATHFSCYADRVFRSRDGHTLTLMCDKVSCGSAPLVENSELLGNMSSEYFFQDQVSYSCNPGYEIQGESIVTCQSNQEFSLLPSCRPVDCGIPPNLPHNSLQYNLTTFEHRAVYVCDTGYVGANDHINCQQDGLWSNKNEICEKVDCGTPTEVAFGVVDINGTTYQDEALYSCYDGYFMSGGAKLQCQANGSWSGHCPKCMPVPCAPPIDLNDGFHTIQGKYSFGGILMFFCNEGYQLVGDSISMCTSTGNWSSLPPTCERVSCGQIPNVVNANHNNGTMLFGDTVTYQCKLGHTLIGPATIECGSNGKLTNLRPTCSPVPCPTVPSITNAAPSQVKSYHFGDQVNYKCLPGYQLEGSPISLLCGSDGNFEINLNEQGACVPVTCSGLSDIKHGSLTQPGGQFGDHVTFTCDSGYFMDGSDNIACTSNATWSNTSPHCYPVVCGMPPNVTNATPVGFHVRTFELSRVAYKCDEGYALKDPNINTLSCLHDGTFSSREISCLPVHCKEIAPVRHGELLLGGTVFGTKASFRCDKGFEMNTYEDVIHFQCLPSGEWSRDFRYIFCDPILCDSLKKPEHGWIGVVNAEISSVLDPEFVAEHQDPYYDMHYGADVSYHCDTGYELKGVPNRTCAADRSWSLSPPTCEPVNCGSAPQVANAVVPDANYTFGMTAFYECTIGFILSSVASSKTCQSDRQFGGENIACLPAPCDNLPTVAHGSPSVAHAVFGDVVTYTCENGYENAGNNSVKCGALGFFSSPTPVCDKIKCPPLPSINDANYQFDGISYGNIAVISCEPGFKFNNEEININLTCQADRTWSHDLAGVACDLNPCERISGIGNGDITVLPPLASQGLLNGDFDSDNIYNTRLIFTCDSGYILKGEERIRCTQNATWDYPPPICEPRKCLNPPVVKNAILISNRHFFGGLAKYECIDGYRLTTQSDSRTCNADGRFSDHNVICSPVPCPDIPKVKNGKVVVSGNKTRAVFGDIGTTICDNGYEKRVGAVEFTCLSSGNWRISDDVCLPVACGLAPSVKNALSTTDKDYIYVFGDMVDYTCSTGYVLDSNDVSSLNCQESGQFEDPDNVICNPVPCPQFSVIENGVIDGSVWSFGSEITLTCNDGYTLKPENLKQSTLLCQDNGQWSHDPNGLSCQGIVCNTLESLTHGSIDFSFATTSDNSDLDVDTVIYPSTVVYQCKPGYILVGRSKRKCLEQGSWSGEAPYCQPVDCGKLPQILHGAVEGDQITTLGNTATYICDEGYNLEPKESTNRECLETGIWSGVNPICAEIICDIGPLLDHGTLSTSVSISYSNSVTASCGIGYILHGNAVRTCGSDGTLEGEAPECVPVNCGTHPPVNYGILSTEQEVTFNKSIWIECDHSYQMLGDGHRICQSDGTWSGVTPICVGLRTNLDPIFDEPGFGVLSSPLESTSLACPKPNIGSHVKLATGGKLLSRYDDGTELEFCCKIGYLPHNQMATKCENGNWTNIPTCLPACKKRCLNNGKCSNQGTCSCVHGWAGSRCHRPICALPCLNGGYCSAPFKCSCPKGWTGSRCQAAVCEQECMNGGKCVEPNRCNCPYGFTNDDCSMKSFFNFW